MSADQPEPDVIHGTQEESPFMGEQFNVALLSTLLRCYDLLTVIAMNTNSEKTKEVIALHRRGDFWNDPPKWAPVSWEHDNLAGEDQ